MLFHHRTLLSLTAPSVINDNNTLQRWRFNKDYVDIQLLTALREELAGFILRDVADRKGEFYHLGLPLPTRNECNEGPSNGSGTLSSKRSTARKK